MGAIPIGTPESSEQGNSTAIPIPDNLPTNPIVLTESNVNSDGNPVTIPDSLPADPVVLTEPASENSGSPITIPDELPADPTVLTDPPNESGGSPITVPDELPSDPVVLTDATIIEEGSPITIPEALPADPTVLTDGLSVPTTTGGFTLGNARRIPFMNGNRDDFTYDVGFEYNMNSNTITVENITLAGLADLNSMSMDGITVDTIETTLTDDDTHLPTSGAVYDAIAAVAFGDLLGQVTSIGLTTSLDISSITDQPDLAVGLLSTDELLVNDDGSLARMDISVLQSYMQTNLTFSSYTHPNHTGQVLSTGDGATTLDISAITAQPASITLVSSDELLINDGGVLSRMDVSVLQTYMQSNLSFSSITDHGALTGLTDDDHAQYYNSTRLAAEGYITNSYYSFENGLTETAGVVQLGGTLTQNTLIAATTYTYTLTGADTDSSSELYYDANRVRLTTTSDAAAAWDDTAAEFQVQSSAVSSSITGFVYDDGVGDGILFTIGLANSVTIDDPVNSLGAQYGGNYSTAGIALGDRWIPDYGAVKAYTDTATTNSANWDTAYGWGDHSGLYANLSHTHGNITNAGAIGSTANLPIITTTSGVLIVSSFGTGSNTFCEGDDSRLSDSRTPTSHTLLSHTISGETLGHVLAADSATTYSIRQLLGSEISNDLGWDGDTTYTFANGLTETGGSVVLGGTLTGSTTISGLDNNLIFEGTAAGGSARMTLDETGMDYYVYDTTGYTGAYSQIYVTENTILLRVRETASANYSGIQINPNSGNMTIIDQIDSQGLIYFTDYSTVGETNDLWLPSWGSVKDYADSVAGTTISLGSTTQIPFMNTGGTDFLYDADFTWNSGEKKIQIGTTADSTYAVVGPAGYYSYANGSIYHQISVSSNTASTYSGMIFAKTGGTHDSFSSVPTDAVIGNIIYYAHDGTTYRDSGNFIFQIDGSVATDNFDTKYIWNLKEGASASALMVTLGVDGFEYAADHSTDQAANDRWIPDKGYVDSVAAGVGFGTDNQVPYMNGTTDFQYSANLTFDDTNLTVATGGYIYADRYYRTGATGTSMRFVDQEEEVIQFYVNSSGSYSLEIWDNQVIVAGALTVQSGALNISSNIASNIVIGSGLTYDAYLTLSVNSVTQTVMGWDTGLSAFQIHTGSAFVALASSDFSITAAGAIYMGNLGSDDTEDHVMAINDSTGLLSKRSVASIGGGGWTKTGTNLSPTTGGDDVLLPAASELHFGTSSDKMVGSSNEIKVSINGNEMFTFGDGTNYTHDDLMPNTDGDVSCGWSNRAWDDVWAYEYSFREQTASATPAANTGDLWMSNTNERLYFQNSSIVYDLIGATFVADTGTTYTLLITDDSKVVTLSDASAITCTVPPNSSVSFPLGTIITLVQIGAGQVTIAAGSGVTLRSADGALKLRAQYSSATLIKHAADEWYIVGDITT